VKKGKTAVKAFARKLAGISTVNGEPSSMRVNAVLAYLRGKPLGQRKAILSAYLRLMKRGEYLRTLSIERAGPIDAKSRDTLVESMTGDSGRRLIVMESENPALIAGLKVRLGDDVFDATVLSAINKLGAR
jgi:F-type H+-transporting ATPase subunit delta